MYSMKRLAAVALLIWCLGGGVSLALEAYIPHITPGSGDWTTYLQVDNNKLSTASFTLILYANGIQVYQANHTVNGLSESLLQFSTLAATADSGVISYTDAQLAFRCTYRSSAGGLAEFPLTDGRYQTLGCYFSDISSDITWKGLALANLNSTPATVRLYAIGGGSILGNTTITISPYSKALGLYTQWFPSISFSAIKKIIAASSVGLCGVVISGDATNSRLLFTAASELSSFDTGIPSAGDVSGAWVGTWHSLDTPTDGGQLTLQATQQGSAFSGTLAISNTDCGDVQGIQMTGTVSGSNVTFSGSYNCQGDLATLAFTNGLIVGNTMSGMYQTNVNGNYYDRGTFAVVKQ
jgi:hypothetical protein